MFVNCVHVFTDLRSHLGKKLLKPNKCSFGYIESSYDDIAKNFPLKVRIFIAQNPEIIMNVYFFSEKNILPQNVSLETNKAVLTTLPKTFGQKSKDFFALSPKIIIKLEIFEKKFSKCSSRHVECSFDNPVENFLTEFL